MPATLAPVLRPASAKLPSVSASWHGPLMTSKIQRTVSMAEFSVNNGKAANPVLSIIEVEQIIRQRVGNQYSDLLQAFNTYDSEGTKSVTRGEFRRVLELFCLPLTTNQFNALMAKVDVNRNGTVRYLSFLDKFSANGDTTKRDRGLVQRLPTPHTPGGGAASLDQLISSLRERLSRNPDGVVRALRLFDYNRDCKVQRHELRKVLENFCFSMTDQQFDRLWQQFGLQQSTVINYLDFLRDLGIRVDGGKTQTGDQVKSKLAVDATRNPFSRSQVEHRGLSIEQLDQEFRKKVRSSYETLRKTFFAFDPSHSGFIPLEDMRSVLHQFIMPMNDQLFIELLERCGFKATGKIAWLTFLEKFQDPQSVTNGQTIPIKSKHKANPIHGADQVTSLEELLQLLHNHITSAYSSFREAFLHLDKNRKGKITRRELRRLLDKFKFTISDDQFKELMIVLDPQHTGQIRYHQFLRLFEERETKEGHKWLKSVHRFNDTERPVILAWAAVEELLQEKLSKNWNEVVCSIRYYDPKGEGFISPENLKKLIDKYCFPVANKHFINIMDRLTLRDGEQRVSYLEFFSLLHVDVSPGDTEGLSKQIGDANEMAVADRRADHEKRMTDIDSQAKDRTGIMSLAEVICRIKDRAAQHRISIRDAFKQFDRKGKGQISKADFRKVLTNFGMQMTDLQFSALASQLGFHGNSNAKMDYSGFLSCFEESRTSSQSEESWLPRNNHRVNAIRGDQWGMSSHQLEQRLRTKIRENFSDLREAFHKVDDTNCGYIDKVNFRRLLDNFMFVTNDEEFEKLCDGFNIDDTSKITYQQFLDMFEIRENPSQGHQWLTSQHRFNKLRPEQTVTAASVQILLPAKVHQQYQDVSRAFCRTDTQGQGCISRKEFKLLLGKLQFNMVPAEFKKLWAFYDPANRGIITHDRFLQRIGIGNQFASGDHSGPSADIIQGSHDATANLLTDQQVRQEKMTYNQAVLGVQLTADQVYAALRKRIRDDYTDTITAFKSCDQGKKGFLNLDDIQSLLSNQHLFISDHQFMELAQRLGFESADTQLNYERFCKMFDDTASGPSSDPSKSAAATSQASTPIETISFGQVEEKLRQYISSELPVLEKAFQAFDREGCGRVKAADFRRILDNFCFPMSDNQFKQLLNKCTVAGDNAVDYTAFLEVFSGASTQDAPHWLEQVQKQVRARTPLPLPIEDVMERVKEVVNARVYVFANAFKELDYGGIGVVAKDDFQEILNKHVMRLTPDQFDRFWATLPVNEFGNLDYHTFLSKFSEQAVRPASPASLTPPDSPQRGGPHQDPAQRPSTAIFGRRADASQIDPDLLMTPVERRIRECLSHNWRAVFARCRQLANHNNPELIVLSDFLGALREYGLDLLPGDLVPLLTRHGLRTNGSFQYQNFLRKLVLPGGNQQVETNAHVRKKLQMTGIPMSPADKDADMFPCMLRLRRRLLDDWKDIRKEFRAIDPDALGLVSAGQFRRVLAQFSVKLSEDEFYQLVTHFDKSRVGKVNYNQVIRDFLKTA